MSFVNQMNFLSATISGLPDLMQLRIRDSFVLFAQSIAKADKVFETYLDFEGLVDSFQLSLDQKDKIKTHAIRLLETRITDLDIMEGTK